MANKNNRQLPRNTSELLAIIASGEYEDGTLYNPTPQGPSSGATNSSVTVGNASVSVVKANSERKFVTLSNDSPNNIYLSLGTSAATVGTGLFISKDGGSVTITGDKWTGDIQAIATAPNSNLCKTEV